MGRRVTLGPPYAPFLPDRIRLRLEVVDTPGRPGDVCWQWIGVRDRNGYGRDQRGRYVHRVVWAAYGRPLPPRGWELDHLCRNRACALVAHLEAVPHAENMRRSAAPVFRDGRCHRGHDVTDPAAVYVYPSNGRRACRACRAEAATERNAP